MNATATSSAVDLEPFTSYAPIFGYLMGQVARRAPRLLERRPVVTAFLALYLSRIGAFTGNLERIMRDSSRTTIFASLNLMRRIAYPTYEGSFDNALCVLKPVWPHVDLALRGVLMVPPRARVLRTLRIRLRYAWDERIALDDRLTADHPDTGEPFEFVAALARFMLVLNRRAS